MVAVDMRRKLVRMSDMGHFYTRGDGTYMHEDCGSFTENGMCGSAGDLVLSAIIDAFHARRGITVVACSDDLFLFVDGSRYHGLAIVRDPSLPLGTIELRSASSTLAILSGWTP